MLVNNTVHTNRPIHTQVYTQADTDIVFITHVSYLFGYKTIFFHLQNDPKYQSYEILL